MTNGLKQLKNLSIPQKLIRAMIIKLFQAKLKIGVGLSRAAKTQVIEHIFKELKKILEKNTKQLTNKLGERQRLAEKLHKQYKKPKQLRKIYFHSKDNIWNADLVIMPPENNYRYILTVLDGYTRYAWVIPLKHKDCLSVSNAVVVKCRFWDKLHSMTPPKTLFGKRVHSLTPPQGCFKENLSKKYLISL